MFRTGGYLMRRAPKPRWLLSEANELKALGWAGWPVNEDHKHQLQQDALPAFSVLPWIQHTLLSSHFRNSRTDLNPRVLERSHYQGSRCELLNVLSPILETLCSPALLPGTTGGRPSLVPLIPTPPCLTHTAPPRGPCSPLCSQTQWCQQHCPR